jgi:hypothetical protein
LPVFNIIHTITRAAWSMFAEAGGAQRWVSRSVLAIVVSFGLVYLAAR